MNELMPEHFMFLSAALFIIGMVGVLTRRNVLVKFKSVELMLTAVNISFIGFAWEFDQLPGQLFAVFIIAIAAAEAVIGLGIIMALTRRLDSIDINRFRELRQ
jgi:NADH-quinone oxidoreductase subunit K